MGHKYLKPSEKKFWEWSLDEMASIDLPTMLTYALNVTGEKSLDYVGHSQGTVIALACFSSHVCSVDGKSNIADRVRTFFALAPAPFVGHISSPFFALLAKLHIDKYLEFFGKMVVFVILILLGIYDFAPSTPLLRQLFPFICKDSFLAKEVCMNVICLIAGCDSLLENVNMTRLPVYIDGLPAGTSVQNMAHWSQAIASDHFQMFDYGSAEKNMQHYNSTIPPR
jgi:pimeloyl-ACP methyl ester carboxylesterase